MRSHALERMLSSVVSSGRQGRRRGRNGRKRHVIPAAATLEALEPRVLLSVTAFDVVADGNVNDHDLDGVFETVITNSTSIDQRWIGVPGDFFGRKLGVYEFDLRDVAPGSQLNSAAISFLVNGWTTDTAGNLASADVYAFSGNGFISASDATTPGVLVGTFTILPGGQQQHTLNGDALESFAGGFVTLRITTALDGHGFDTAAIESSTEPAAQLLLDVSNDTSFEVLADGFVSDFDRDGFFDAVDSTGQEIFTRNYDGAGDERGILEFDLRGIAAGRPIISAKLGLDVSYLETVDDGITIHNPQFEFLGYSGDGSITLGDADRAGTVLGSGTAANFGYQEFTLDPDALEAHVGFIAGIRIQTTSMFGNGFAAVSSETPFIAVTPKLIVEFGELPPPEPTTLSVTIAADSIMENAGNDATTATVTRTGSLTDPLLVALETSGKITAPANVTIPAGQASVTFDIGVTDDLLIGPDLAATLTARAEVSAGPYALDSIIVGPASTGFQALAIDGNGNIVTAGYLQHGGTNSFDFDIRRYLPTGFLDRTFGVSGTIQTDFTGQKEVPEAVVIQPDGKIIVAGTASSTAGDFVLARYNANGTLDSTFGSGGKVVTEMGTDFYNELWDIALQSDGKIVAATYSSDDGGRVVRYNVNGTLDSTFGIGGISPVGMGGRAFGIAVQADGKIVIAGETDGGNFNSLFSVARYNTDGSFDATLAFGFNLPGDFDQANDVLIQPDGKILLVGQTGISGSFPPAYDLAMIRLLPDGSFDTSFGSGGAVISDFGGVDDIGSTVALLPDGDIIVGGSAAGTSDGSTTKLGFARYNADGTLEANHFTFTAPSLNEATGIAVRSDGRIFVTTTGHLLRFSDLVTIEGSDTVLIVDNDTNSPPVLSDRTTYIDENSRNGALVTAVIANEVDPGQTLTYSIVSGNEAGAFEINPASGQVFVADSSKLDYETTTSFVLQLRATDNGTPVLSDDATLTISVNDLPEFTLELIVQKLAISEAAEVSLGAVRRTGDLSSPLTVFLHSSDQSEATVPQSVVIAAGETTATFAITAVGDSLLDGAQDVTITASAAPLAGEAFSLDGTFGVGGLATTSLEFNLGNPRGVIAVQDDGKIIVAGRDSHTGSWRLTRLNPDGSLDPTFGINGFTVTAFGPSGISPEPYTITFDNLGRILVGGKITAGIGTPAMARYFADGGLDTTFGGDGIANLETITNGWVEDIEFLPDGDMMLAINFNGTIFFRLARLNSNGTLDTSFDGDGVLTVTSINDPATELKLMDNNRLVVAGGDTVARFLLSGLIDTTFGTNGILTLDDDGSGPRRTHIGELESMADGRLVLSAAISDSTTDTSDAAVIRLTPEGQFDTTFGTGGVAIADIGDRDGLGSIVLQPDGKIVIAGTLRTGTFTGVSAMARFNLDGSLDTSFDGDGLYTASLLADTSESISDLALSPDGELLAVVARSSDVHVARFNAGPVPQLLYAHDSLTVTDATPAPTLSLTILADAISENGGITTATLSRTGDLTGSLLVNLVSGDESEVTVPATVLIPAGQASVSFDVTAVDDALVDGTLNVTVSASAVIENGGPIGIDPTFGAGGSTPTSLVVQTHLPLLAFQSDGKILAMSQDAVQSAWKLARFNADGTVDTSFGTGGAVTTALESSTSFSAPRVLAVQPDGKILVGGHGIFGANAGPLLARYNADGTLDATFAQGGVAEVDALGGAITDVIFEDDGKITLAVNVANSLNAPASFRLARLNADGSFDQTFGGGDGQFDLGYGSSRLTHIVRQPDGKYLLAGDQRIARINANGSRDNTFGFSSSQSVAIGSNSFIVDVDLMSDGRILLAVQTSAGTDNSRDMGAVRLLPNGQFDAAFDGDGHVAIDFAALDDYIVELEVQTDGRILLAGYTQTGVSDTGAELHEAAFVRLTDSGSLDTTFDGDGRYQVALMATNHGALDMLLDDQDRMIVIGGAQANVNLYRINTGIQSTLLTANDTVDVTSDDTANTRPTVSDQTFAVNENSANGTVVGTVFATDPDPGQTLTYSITGGNEEGAFAINPSTGQITVADGTKLDFETKANYSLTVLAVDDHAMPLAGIGTTTILVTDVLENDRPIVADQSFSLDENSASATAVGALVASDPEGQALSYAIIAGNQLVSRGPEAFAIDTAGNITVADAAQMNFEQRAVWTLTVRVTDSAGSSTDATVTVNLNDLNEAPFVSGSANGAIVENHPIGETILGVAAGDPDAGQTITYSIVGGNTDGVFSINPTTGKLSVVNPAPLDFETNSGYTLRIRITDSGSPQLFTETDFPIALLDANEAPVVTGGTATIAENPANGTSVFTVAAVDQDNGQTLTYAITAGNSGGAFAINASTGEITVADSSLLSFESKASYTLIVEAADNGTPSALSGVSQVVVNLTDVNERPVVNDQTFTLPENTINGIVIDTIAATDPDGGQTHTFAITGTHSGAFAVSAGGAISIANAALLDFETTPTFTFNVQITDSGTPSLSDTAVVTINLTNLNEAPTVAGGTFSVAENSPADTIVGSVTANDVDAGTTLTYSISGGDPFGAFTIDAATGQITVEKPGVVNFEATPLFNLDVQVSDGTLSAAAVVTVNVTDVNEAPSIADATFGLAENTANGTPVGTVAATDPDNGQTLTYLITGGNTGGAFAINSATGEITIANAAAIDFESNPLFTLAVSATDNGTPSSSDTAVVTINLSNVNEAPTATGGTFNVAENSANGTAVATVVGTDVDAGTTLAYSITGGNSGGAFAINATTGQITVANSGALNFETTPMFNLDVQVSDGTQSAATVVVVNVTDVNEAPSIVGASFTLAENTTNGTVVGSVAATDPDNNPTLSYAILVQHPANAFAINSATGEITVVDSAALDFETNSFFSLRVGVTDSGGLNDIASVRIDLSNVNEAPTVAGGTVSLPETSLNGATVFTVDADDVDAGQTLTFAITAGNESGVFGINAATGVITVANASLLNNETTPSYALTVQATDNGTPANLSGSAVVTVNITDVNKAPVVEDQTFTIAENSANGSPVGTIIGSDPDAGQSITYAITGAHSGAFAVSASGVVTVADAAQLNFEASPSFTLNIVASDNGTPAESDTAVITINLTNVNEAPSIADVTIDNLAENSANGTAVGTIVATDPDAGQTHTFAITGTHSGAFAVSADGQVTVANAALLDFEATPTFTFTVQVTDSGDPALSDTAVVTINLSNVNEAPTVAGGPFSIAENSPAGTLVGAVTGSDPDAGAALTYTITGGTGLGVFSINALTRAITVVDPTQLDFETTTSFTLDVQVSDNANPALIDTTQVVINLTNINEAPTLNDAGFSLAENTATGTVVGTVAGTDPESGALTYAITDAGIDGVFTINAATGQITVENAAALDLETNPSFTLTISATDAGTPGLSDTAVVTINLTNVNEAPTVTGGPFTVSENSAPGTAVGTVVGSDVDAGATLTFAIINGNTGGAFAIDSTGLITVANTAALDFEATPSFDLDIQVSDGTLTGATVLAVNVTNVNEAPSLGDASATISENTANGTLVATVAATDPDSGSSFTYAITDGNIGGAFTIDGSGNITVADSAALDFETTPVFALTVSATDNGAPGLSDTATVTIDLININEAPSLADASFNVAENSANGTIIGTIAAEDVDGPSLTYTITGGTPGTSAFAISADGVITVADASQLNFESGVTSFVLDVQVSDGELTDSAAVTIDVTDVNEAPTLNDATFSLAENSDNGTFVGTVTATDPDASQSHIYAIINGNVGDAFAIDAATGQITVANSAALNFEVNPTFTLVVQVTDSGNPAASDQATVTIDLTDITDEGTPPVIADQSFTVDENSDTGAAVGTVAASPGEGGNPIIFEIAGGNESGAFAIHPLTGALTVLDASLLDHETNPSFNLTVKVTDSGDPTLFATAAVTVNVANLPEPVMDVMPFDDRNILELHPSNRHVAVALLSTDDFDATQVDLLSIGFGATGTEDSLTRFRRWVPHLFIDINRDGRKDLLLAFDVDETGFALGEQQARFTGSLLDGTQISATQTIYVEPRQKRGHGHGHDKHDHRGHDDDSWRDRD